MAEPMVNGSRHVASMHIAHIQGDRLHRPVNGIRFECRVGACADKSRLVEIWHCGLHVMEVYSTCYRCNIS